jgi:hypothetical protein
MEMALHDFLKVRIHWVLLKIGLCGTLDLLVGMQHQSFYRPCHSSSCYLKTSQDVFNLRIEVLLVEFTLVVLT